MAKNKFGVANTPKPLDLDLRPGQSIELLKELHILTRDGKINQDSRRKLKQVYHLYQFIEKLSRRCMLVTPPQMTRSILVYKNMRAIWSWCRVAKLS